MNQKNWNKILAGLIVVPIPFVARAETYLTEEQAAKVLFPGLQMKPTWMDLSPLDIKTIAKESGAKPLSPRARVFWGPNKEAVIVDRVLGKHEYITYAVGVEPDGKVKGIEILDYRETYGGQIRNEAWRRVFVGKTAKDPLTLDKDIPNISGATLSSRHVTDGVRRILYTYEILRTRAQA